MANFTFERIEKKYLLNEEKYNQLMNRLEPYIKLDDYGLHTICNVYFDTDNFDLIRRSVEKPAYKEKFRVRSYGVPNDNSKVFLEIKKKYKGIVYKRRIQMDLSEAHDYLLNGVKPDLNTQIFKEIDYMLNFYDLKPKVYIAYDRMAYSDIIGEGVRLTIDQNIRSRDTKLSLKDGDEGEVLLPQGNYLMEIKVPGACPLFLSNILTELEIYPNSFSKYGNVYKRMLRKNKVLNELDIAAKVTLQDKQHRKAEKIS